MWRIIGFELKKILMRPVLLATLFIILVINCMTAFTDETGIFISPGAITAQKSEQSKYAGEINQNWEDAIQKKLDAISEDPESLMSEDEKEQVRQEYLERGYTRQYADSLPNSAFLKLDIKNGLPYRILEGAEYFSKFYSNAEELSVALGKYYRSEFQGQEGEVLAEKAEKMYGYLAKNYTAYYGYSLGWEKLSSMQKRLPFTVGLFLLIALSSVFSGEYSQETDSLLLSSKYGKGKLTRAKIAASFFLASGLWLSMQLLNLVLINGIFGLDGAQTFVQDWLSNYCPFAFTQITSYFAVCSMSYIGVLIFTATILFISAKTKSPFITLLICGTVLMLPVIGDIAEIVGLVNQLLPFAPANILIASNHFTFFKAYYVFDHALLMQVAVPVAAVVASGLLIPFACRAFGRHQVEN